MRRIWVFRRRRCMGFHWGPGHGTGAWETARAMVWETARMQEFWCRVDASGGSDLEARP